MYVMHLHRNFSGTKKAPCLSAKRLRTKCAPLRELRYNQSLVTRKIAFPVPRKRQVSRLAVSDAAAFPIAQWLRMPDSVNPLTVTRSHRFLTCFPFTR